MNAGFWMSALAGALGGGLILVAAPWAVRFYDEPRLTGLLVFLALTSPLITIHIVPLSRLESDLRFRQVAFVNTLSGTSATLLAVLCAALGLGAFSLIVPRAVVALGSAGPLW
jgi:PST family polysaccharide transporter